MNRGEPTILAMVPPDSDPARDNPDVYNTHPADGPDLRGGSDARNPDPEPLGDAPLRMSPVFDRPHRLQ